MSKHLPEWNVAPHDVDPAIATAADTIEQRLTPLTIDSMGTPTYRHQLSDAPNRVLRVSDVRDWDTIMLRLTDAERLKIAKRVV